MFLSLGSNIGSREVFLTEAIRRLDKHFARLSVSSIYQTAPQDYTDQDDFYNIIAVYRYDNQNVYDILNVCHEIENGLGRAEYHHIDKGPRTIDIDIIAIDGVNVDKPDLHIPHLAYQRRNFVLIPLDEVLSHSEREEDRMWLSDIRQWIKANGEQNVTKIGELPIL